MRHLDLISKGERRLRDPNPQEICRESGCQKRTNDRKPFCEDHIMNMPYAILVANDREKPDARSEILSALCGEKLTAKRLFFELRHIKKKVVEDEIRSLIESGTIQEVKQVPLKRNSKEIITTYRLKEIESCFTS